MFVHCADLRLLSFLHPSLFIRWGSNSLQAQLAKKKQEEREDAERKAKEKYVPPIRPNRDPFPTDPLTRVSSPCPNTARVNPNGTDSVLVGWEYCTNTRQSSPCSTA